MCRVKWGSMDGIISEHSRQALEAVSPKFTQLQAQIAKVHDEATTANGFRSDGGTQAKVADTLLQKARDRAQLYLVRASVAFEEAATELKTHIYDEFREDVKSLVADNIPINSKNLAAVLSPNTQQDIRTFLVIGSIGRLMHEALENANLHGEPVVNGNAEYFDEMFREAIQPKAVTKERLALRQDRYWEINAYSLDRAFQDASTNLQEGMIEELQNYGWPHQQKDFRAKALVSAGIGAVLGTASAYGVSDGGVWLPIIGLLGGGVIGGAGYGLDLSLRMGLTPKEIIAKIGGAHVAGVAMEASPLVAIHQQLNPQSSAEMLAAALQRASRGDDRGRG